MFAEARRNPRARTFFESLSRLGRSDGFTLAAIASNREGGGYQEIYVHAKIAIGDDAWATIGSTNIAERSFHRDFELNVSFWHATTARTLRERLPGMGRLRLIRSVVVRLLLIGRAENAA